MVFEASSGGDARTRILEAAALLLDARVDATFPSADSFDALWGKADSGLYALRVLDCRTAPADEITLWAATEARRPMLDASGWEQRLGTDGDPELILILLLSDLRNPEMVKLGFEAEIEKMHKPTRTRVWVTTEAFATSPPPSSPVDLFVVCDIQDRGLRACARGIRIKICPNCGLQNLSHSQACARCDSDLTKTVPTVQTEGQEAGPHA